MALNSLGLGILISARDEASQVFKRVQRSFLHLDGQSDAFVKKMRTNGMQMAAGLGMVSVGVTGLGAAFSAAQAAGKFEAVMTNLRVVSKASTTQMEEFRKAILGAGADNSKFGPVETAEALQDLAQRGFTAKQALEMLKPVTDLATASLGQLGLGQAAEVVTNAIHGFGLTSDQAADRVDQMAKASNMSGMAFKDLTYGIGKIARGAMAADQTFQEAIITLGMMRNQMHSIELASNAGSVAMERLVAGTKGSLAIQKYVDVFDKGTGKIRPFRQIMLDLIPALDKMGVKASKSFLIKGFGTRGLAGAQAMLTQLKTGMETNDGRHLKGQDLINWQDEQMAKSGGTANEISVELLKTLPGQLQLLTASWERFKVVIGEPFAEALKPLTKGILNVIQTLKNVLLEMPASTKKVIAQFFLVGAALTTVFGALLAGKALMALFGVTFAGIAAAAGSLIVPLLAIGAAIGGIILMMKAFEVHAEQTGGGVIGFFTDMARKVGLAFKGLMQLFTEGAFSGDIMLELNKAENSGVKAFAIKIYLWVERIKNFLRGMWDGFQEKVRELRPTFDMLVDSIKSLASAFGVSVGSANDNLTAWEEAGASGKSLGDTLASVAGTISTILTVAVETATVAVEAFKVAWDLLGPAAKSAAQMIKGAVQIMAGALNEDGKTMWEGFVDLSYAAMNGVVKLFLWVVRAFTSAYDEINRMLGIDSSGSWTKAIKELEGGFDVRLAGLKKQDMASSGASYDPLGWGRLGIGNRPASSVVPAPTATTAPAVAAARAFIGPTQEMLKTPSAEQKAPQIINLTSILKWDNETLARLQKQIKTDADARGFAVGAHP